MSAMDRDPTQRRVLKAADAEDRKEVFEPTRAVETAVRQQAVVTKVDAEGAEDVKSGDADRDACPIEEPGQKGEESDGVVEEESAGVGPDDAFSLDRRRVGQSLGLIVMFRLHQRGHAKHLIRDLGGRSMYRRQRARRIIRSVLPNPGESRAKPAARSH